MKYTMNRRKFMHTTASVAAGLGVAGLSSIVDASKIMAAGGTPDHAPKRKLGKTEYNVSLFSLGGESTVQIASKSQQAVEIIDRALDLGVNYIDTAPSYGAGGSETNIGLVMARRRNQVFLASKTHDRTYDGTMRLIEQSLERLQTDYLDLYQVHNIRSHDDIERALSRNGAVEAMERLRSQGVIRHIGITGHRNSEALLYGINSYDFDTILMALNAGDIFYDPFQGDLLNRALEKRMGIIAMKITAVNNIFRADGLTTMDEAMGYALSFPVSTAIIGITSVGQVDENVRVARDFRPMSQNRLASIEEKVKPYNEQVNFFKRSW